MTFDTWGHIVSTGFTFESHRYNSEHDHLVTESPAASCDYKVQLTAQAAENGGNVLSVPGSVQTAPGCADGTITGGFTLATSNGAEVTTEFVETP